MNNTTFFLSNNTSSLNKHQNDFLRSKDLMGSSDFLQNQQQNVGLARFRSAPSSYFTTLLESSSVNENNSSAEEESDAVLFSALFSQKDHTPSFGGAMKQENIDASTDGYGAAVNGGGGAIVGSYSVGMENQVQLRTGNGNLARQSSSPAGFLSGFGVMGEVGNYTVKNYAEMNSLTNGLSFSSGQASSSRFMPTIPENACENASMRSPPNGRSGQNNDANGREYDPLLSKDSWDESPFNNLKRNRNGDLKMGSHLGGLENLNGETRNNAPGLAHHLSLPKTAGEMGVVEKFLQFEQETVPCQIRAKRGCATHPRSIAERMRRTRISERMKKLQDLFPSMDKQTNTAEMLDLAVEYIKDLQKQVQTLTDLKAKCICSSKQKGASGAS